MDTKNTGVCENCFLGTEETKKEIKEISLTLLVLSRNGERKSEYANELREQRTELKKQLASWNANK